MATKPFSSKRYWPGSFPGFHCVQPSLLDGFQEQSLRMQTNEPVFFRTFSNPWLGPLQPLNIKHINSDPLAQIPLSWMPQWASQAIQFSQGFKVYSCPMGDIHKSWRQPVNSEMLTKQGCALSAMGDGKFRPGNLQARSGRVLPGKTGLLSCTLT